MSPWFPPPHKKKQLQEKTPKTPSPLKKTRSQTLNVWYIYLHLVNFMVNVYQSHFLWTWDCFVSCRLGPPIIHGFTRTLPACKIAAWSPASNSDLRARALGGKLEKIQIFSLRFLPP